MPMAPEPTTSERLRHLLRDHGLLVAPDQLAVGLQPGQLTGARTGGQDDVLGLQRLLAALDELDRELALAGELGLAVEDGDLVLLEQEADAAAQLLRHAAAALDHGRGIEAGVVGGEAEARRVAHQLQHLGRAQQRLGRDAAPVEADAAQMLALDQRHLHLQLRRADGRHVAAGTAADDDQVEALGQLNSLPDWQPRGLSRAAPRSRPATRHRRTDCEWSRRPCTAPSCMSSLSRRGAAGAAHRGDHQSIPVGKLLPGNRPERLLGVARHNT